MSDDSQIANSTYFPEAVIEISTPEANIIRKGALIILIFSIISCIFNWPFLWAFFVIWGLDYLKNFLQKVGKKKLYTKFRLVLWLWCASGFADKIEYASNYFLTISNFSEITITPQYTNEYVLWAKWIVPYVSFGLFVFILIMIYKLFRIIVSVFIGEEMMEKPKIFLILYCLFHVISLNMAYSIRTFILLLGLRP